MASSLKKDIVGNLPIELVHKIMTFLDGRDLGNSSMVCRKWRDLTNSDFLWKRICKQDFPEELHVSPCVIPGKCRTLGDSSAYKARYSLGATCLRNWKRNRYWTLKLVNPLVTAYIGNGAILVTVEVDTVIQVYDLNDTRARVIQRLPPFQKKIENRRLIKVMTGKNHLVLEVRRPENRMTLFLCYVWLESKLKFCEVLYCSNAEENFVQSAPRIEAIKRTNTNPDVHLTGLIGESFIFYNWKKSKFYFWSSKERRITGSVVRPGGAREFAFKKMFFLCDTTRTTHFIKGYDPRGDLTFNIEVSDMASYTDDIALHFNKKHMMGEFIHTGHFRVVKVWNLENGVEVYSGPRIEQEVILHPKLPVICYVSALDESYEVVVRDVLRNVVVSRTPFKLIYGTDPVFNGGGHLSLVHYKYVLYIPGYDSDFYREQILFELESGRIIFHERKKRLHIEYVGGKLIQGYKYEKGNKIFTLRVYT